MHQSFTDAVVKLFFDNSPMFADSFRVVSIHCVARGLGASFLYKVPISCGGYCDITAFLFIHGTLFTFLAFFKVYNVFVVKNGKWQRTTHIARQQIKLLFVMQ